MTAILKVNEGGTLTIPAEILPKASPDGAYKASSQAGGLLISAAADENDFWTRTTPQQRAAAFVAWVEKNKVHAGLSDYAVSRDSIYED